MKKRIFKGTNANNERCIWIDSKLNMLEMFEICTSISQSLNKINYFGNAKFEIEDQVIYLNIEIFSDSDLNGDYEFFTDESNDSWYEVGRVEYIATKVTADGYLEFVLMETTPNEYDDDECECSECCKLCEYRDSCENYLSECGYECIQDSIYDDDGNDPHILEIVDLLCF